MQYLNIQKKGHTQSVPRRVPERPPRQPLAAQVDKERPLQRAAERGRPPHPDEGELPPGDCHRNVAVVADGQRGRQHLGRQGVFSSPKVLGPQRPNGTIHFGIMLFQELRFANLWAYWKIICFENGIQIE